MLGWGRTLVDVAPPYQLYVLGVLVAVSLLQQADQWALPTLQASGLQCSSCGKESGEFYRHCRGQCLELGDVAMGLLTGPAFTFSSVLVSLPLGWMADRWHRTWILCVGLVVWSAATFLASFSDTFWHLALSRIVLGIGGATVAPTAYSLLSDYFHPNKRALVFAFFSITIYLGELVGLLSAFISQEWSWRVAFAALGLPGFGVALLLGLSVREPARGMSERWLANEEAKPLQLSADETQGQPRDTAIDDAEARAAGWAQAVAGLWHRVAFLARLPAFVTHCAVAAVRNAGGYSLGAWLQVFLVRRHGLTPSEFTPWLMVIVPLGGGLGATLGGWLADVWHRRDVRGKAWLIAASQLVAFAFVSYFFLVESDVACFILLFPAYVFAEMWYAPAAAISQDLVFPSLRGLATAVYFCVTSLGALAPLLVGALNGWFDRRAPYHDPDDPQGPDPTFPLVVVVGGSYLLSGLGFGLTSLLMRSHKRRMRDVLHRIPSPPPSPRSAGAPARRHAKIVSAEEELAFLGVDPRRATAHYYDVDT